MFGSSAGSSASTIISGGTVSYGYNAANQLISLAQPGGSCSGTVLDCTTFGVDNDGHRTSTTYPQQTNTVMTFTLDAAERPIEAKAVTGSTVISDFSYSYAPPGGGDSEVVQTRTDHTNGLVTSYSYDALDELTAAVEKNGSTTTAAWLYCYDNAGNRTHASTSTSSTATCTTSPTTSYGYNAANELTSLNGSSTGWAYDGDGNETAGNSAIARSSETYSASNQLLSGTMGGAAFTASYAGLTNDERVSTDAASFENGPEGIASQTTSGTTAYYTRDPSGALNAQRVGTDSHYYYIFDGQGSVVAIVNGSGGLKNTYGYDPYGNTRSSSTTLSNPFQYIAGYNDATGLYHLGARYYDPTLGRFTQQDTTGQGANLYTYTGDNPTNAVDPNGLCFLGIFGSNCGNVACHAAIAVGLLGAGLAALGFGIVAGPGILGFLVSEEAASTVGIGTQLIGTGLAAAGGFGIFSCA